MNTPIGNCVVKEHVFGRRERKVCKQRIPWRRRNQQGMEREG